MILTDTTLVVDFLRAPTPRLVKIIKDNSATICGATLAEIYAGARSPQDFKKYDAILSIFGRVKTPQTIWPTLGRNLALLASKGITVPFPDGLIATIAIENGLELWHHDRHFPIIQSALPALKLFLEPP